MPWLAALGGAGAAGAAGAGAGAAGAASPALGAAGAAGAAAPAAAGAGVYAPAAGALGGSFAPGLGLPAGGGVFASPGVGLGAAGQAVPLGFPTAAQPGFLSTLGQGLSNFGHGFWDAYSQPLQQIRSMVTGNPAATPSQPTTMAGRLGQQLGQSGQQMGGGGKHPMPQQMDAAQMLQVIQGLRRRFQPTWGP